MVIHRNAKLGLGGRLAPVHDIEAGCSAGKRGDAMASRRRPHASGGDAGARRGTDTHGAHAAAPTLRRGSLTSRVHAWPKAAPPSGKRSGRGTNERRSRRRADMAARLTHVRIHARPKAAPPERKAKRARD